MGISVVKITSIEYGRNRELLSAFIPLYLEGFPNPDEREDPEQWDLRLSDAGRMSDNPKSFFVLIGENLAEGNDPRVQGGIVFEYYSQSRAGLLTYLAVAKDQRGKGYARTLIVNALDILKNEAIKSGASLSAVFAEASDINWTDKEDSIPPADRLEILAKLGAKWIDIKYVQPPLGTGKRRVYDLLLLYFPAVKKITGSVPALVVREFLREFYGSLGVLDPSSDGDFRKMERSLQGETLRLKELPSVEKPILNIEKVSICLHSVYNLETLQKDAAVDPEEDSGRLEFKSFELDLLAYRFQGDPPFMSRCAKNHKREIVVHYPARLEYESEGRCITLIASTGCRSRKACAILSQTHFPESNITVFHLTLHPVEGEHFTEFDLIKLSKTHGGIQEGDRLSEKLRFSFQDGGPESYSLSDFIAVYAGAELESPVLPRAGTIEVDVSSIKSPCDMRKLLLLIGKAYSNEPGSRDNLENIFKSSSAEGMVLKAFCGIITGIFDFGRMCFAEVLDTLEPTVVCNTGIIRLHRSNLVSLADGDEILDYCWNTLGISPYLIIPQAIMIHNDRLVDLAEKKMLSVMTAKELKPRKLSFRDYRNWDKIREDAERRLKLEHVPNVFQYSTERQILEKGIRHRGSDQKEKTEGDRLQELTAQIASMRADLRQKADINKSILLGLLAGMSLRPLLFALVGDWIGNVPVFKYRVAWYAFAFIFGCFVGFFVYTARSIKRI